MSLLPGRVGVKLSDRINLPSIRTESDRIGARSATEAGVLAGHENTAIRHRIDGARQAGSEESESVRRKPVTTDRMVSSLGLIDCEK